jgi:hypothetical protein
MKKSRTIMNVAAISTGIAAHGLLADPARASPGPRALDVGA